MIQWIALAVAIDAESKASDARDKAKVSLKRSDILSIQEYKDGNDVPYVKIRISEYSQVWHDGDHLVGLFVPGTIEAVAAVIGGV